MSISRLSARFVVLFALLITSATGCSVLQTLGEPNAGAKNSLTSDYAVAELGNITLFDEKQTTIAISYILKPGSKTEYGRYYDVKILWNKYVLSGSSLRFRSQDFKFEGQAIVLQGTAATEFAKLLIESKEYQQLRREFENVQQEKRRSHEKEEEFAYNLFWKGEAPSYAEYKSAMQQLQNMDTREKQIIQKFYEFPYTARLPSSFVDSLEMMVTAK